jgi:small GTP-binding protein
MSTNPDYEYKESQKLFASAKTDEEKLKALEYMLSVAPSHKSSENLRANIKTRIARIKSKMEDKKAHKKAIKKAGIKKDDMQACLIGLKNSGKSSLINLLTNAHSITGDYDFTTKYPILGTMHYENCHIQLIDTPAIESEYFDQGLANNTDLLLILINNTKDLEQINSFLANAPNNRIIVFNKSDLLNSEEKRKLEAQLRSKKLNFVIISTITQEGIEDLKKKIFSSFKIIRIYTKEPGKESTGIPILFKYSPSVKDVAEKILHGFSQQVKETRIWGPSSKFAGQKVGLEHLLKDKDIVEFRTK